MAQLDYETHEHDVIVIGAGGAGLRAAIEAAAELLVRAKRPVIVAGDAVTQSDALGEMAEVAELLGVSAANQRVLLHRGRAAVRAALEKYLDPRVTDHRPRDSGPS